MMYITDNWFLADDAKFEKISQYAEDDKLKLPERKTKYSAGYDFQVAEDIIIPPYEEQVGKMVQHCLADNPNFIEPDFLTLDGMAALTKATKAKPTLVPTGIKCKIPGGTYLELSVRSSCPLKYWLVLANGVGIIDADYYNNPDNEGHIYFQMINLSPFPIKLQKGDAIGQGIIKPYFITKDESAATTYTARTGGFGSTNG